MVYYLRFVSAERLLHPRLSNSTHNNAREIPSIATPLPLSASSVRPSLLFSTAVPNGPCSAAPSFWFTTLPLALVSCILYRLLPPMSYRTSGRAKTLILWRGLIRLLSIVLCLRRANCTVTEAGPLFRYRYLSAVRNDSLARDFYWALMLLLKCFH